MSLKANNLGYYYNKDKWIFRNLELKVEPGEILGIFGYSGCGKTSLSKVLSGFLAPKEGQVTIDDKSYVKGSFNEVQLICQHPEKIMNPLWRMDRVIEESYIPEKYLMDLLGIREEWLSRYPIELSGGELQRFSILRALNPKTKYLIADEMTTMLDAITQASIWEILLEIVRKRNMGLIVISHERAIIDKICHSCYNMDKENFLDNHIYHMEKSR